MEVDLPVLIVGEAGTGRREIAKAIHEARHGKGRWLVPAECKAGTDGEMELALFGSVGDTASNFEKQRTGVLDLAGGSTVLLDDIRGLAVEIQRRILRVVRTGGYSRRGGKEIIPIDVRFIGLSFFDPAEKFGDGHFDPKFLEWLSAIQIIIPPLRDHLEDLPMLAESILRGFTKSERKKLSPAGYRALLGHHWPGNLPELRSILALAGFKARGGIITDRELLALFKRDAGRRSDRKAFATEREWILDGLNRTRFRRAEAAQFLRISRKTLYNKIRQYGFLSVQGESATARLQNAARTPLRE
jgi:DNA-binding NtrC family response regulator